MTTTLHDLAQAAAEPLEALAELQQKLDPCLMVIFGATGDLAGRKLAPAIANLHRLGQLPERFAILGSGRSKRSDDDLRRFFRDSLAEHGRQAQPDDSLLARLFYQAADMSTQDDRRRLAQRIELLDRERDLGGNVLFYLATPAQQFEPLVRALGRAGLANDLSAPGQARTGWRRIIIEKPFGQDLASARSLNAALAEVFGEQSTFRIDHYLGKETVQNVMVMRFANSIFELMWNREHIDHVQITVAESLGVEGRGKFFEQTGVLRDIAQNHLMQLLTLTAMEPPAAGTPDGIRDEKSKVLRSLRPLRLADVVAGQYAAGRIDGRSVPGYRDEPDVAADSSVETFLVVRAFVDNWRWAGVPFYLRCGKRLPRKVTEIAIQFQRPPVALFHEVGCKEMHPNRLIIRIQPNEGIALQFGAKAPGARLCIEPVNMDFRYHATFDQPLADAYQRLLLDVMMGNSALFLRYDAVEAAWAYYQPVLDAWAEGNKSVASYPAGTWGPDEVARLLVNPDDRWREP